MMSLFLPTAGQLPSHHHCWSTQAKVPTLDEGRIDIPTLFRALDIATAPTNDLEKSSIIGVVGASRDLFAQRVEVRSLCCIDSYRAVPV